MKKIKKRILIVILSIILFFTICAVALFAINGYVKSSVEARIISENTAEQLDDFDCIIVLGCGVKNDVPSAMLADRLSVGISLYKSGASSNIIMSGDHGREDYDEVNVMKQYAIDEGVPSDDIFMDHAGFSTYESIVRAKEIFEAERILIVTQQYHLYRALYIAEHFGLEAYGVSADLQSYRGQQMREFREILARNKDFFSSIFKPKPTYLGEAIPVQNGNGDITNDK